MSEGSLGDYIRRQRELHELSLREFAKLTGISNPYLSQIEHGRREPSERVLESMARALEVSADTLYELSGRSRAGAEEHGQSAVVAAVKADPGLTGRQRQALLEVYYSFSGHPRSRRAAE